jgi:hypothetical protein
MQDSKENSWANNFDRESATDSVPDEQVAIVKDDATREADGWQQYRRWISKAPAPRGRRMGVDPSIYTWKGYRSWSEQIKRNWSDS